MKVILWGINYAPEPTGIAPFNRELCEFLVEQGHEVAAVTSFPYYPTWRKAPADRRCWYRAETVGGVSLHRCWCYVPKVVTNVRRILHELSFGVTSMGWVLTLPRADVYVVVSPPLGLGFFAWVATTLKRSRFIFHVQDLQPDSALGLGMLKRGLLARALFGLERLAYAKSAMTTGISPGMIQAFGEKGVSLAKSRLLPNWLRTVTVAGPTTGTRTAARRHFGVGDDTLLAVYAGNLGRKQHLDILIEAAALLPSGANPGAGPVTLLIAGDGAARLDLEQALLDRPGVSVKLLPLLSDTDYTMLLRATDVALITQAAGTGQFFFPSKLLSVLAAGLPVVAVADADSELSLAVRAGGFGCTVPPGDAAGLASVLQNLTALRPQLAAWAERTSWVKQFSREAVLPRFEAMLQQVVLAPAHVPVPGLASQPATPVLGDQAFPSTP